MAVMAIDRPDGDPTGSDDDRFPTTRWSRVAAAGDPDSPGGRAALEGLCRDYWYPLYALVRRKGHGPDEAADLVQGFLADLLERGDLSAAAEAEAGSAPSSRPPAPTTGRTVATTTGRGSAAAAAADLDRCPAGRGPLSGRARPYDDPERLYERRWALTLLDPAPRRGGRRGDKGGPWGAVRATPRGPDRRARRPSYAALAGSLGLTEGAVRMAAMRLRRRFRDALRAEVARTVDDPSAVDDELTALFEAMAR